MTRTAAHLQRSPGHPLGASPVSGPRFNEHIRLRLVNDFLIDPSIERALLDRDPQPKGMRPGSRGVVEPSVKGIE